MGNSLWPDFEEAFIHTESGGRWHRRVMGVRLRPFCAYHALWLEAVASPLWVGGPKPPSLADLALAARICACDYGEATRAVRRPGWWRKLAFLARVPRAGREFAAWRDYITDYLSPPRKGGAKTKAPDPNDPMARFGIREKHERHGRNYADLPGPLTLVAGLMHLGHVPPKEAWMMPYSEAEWLLAALHYQAGHEISVMGEHDREWARGLKVGMWKEKDEG